MTEEKLKNYKNYIQKRLKGIDFYLSSITLKGNNEMFLKQIRNYVEDIDMATSHMQYTEKKGI